ncbi:hypothetical protein B0O80DRAFT_448199 [Mortierella sp. GBAus27b]|nr:hypothetical protein B0O80DRAFT_448199 [Mortierella sp. GBAus27b]
MFGPANDILLGVNPELPLVVANMDTLVVMLLLVPGIDDPDCDGAPNVAVIPGILDGPAAVSSLFTLLSKIEKYGGREDALEDDASTVGPARLKRLLVLSDSSKILAISASIRSWRARSSLACKWGWVLCAWGLGLEKGFGREGLWYSSSWIVRAKASSSSSRFLFMSASRCSIISCSLKSSSMSSASSPASTRAERTLSTSDL